MIYLWLRILALFMFTTFWKNSNGVQEATMSKLRIVKTATKVRLVNKLLEVSNIGKIEKLFILFILHKSIGWFLFHV